MLIKKDIIYLDIIKKEEPVYCAAVIDLSMLLINQAELKKVIRMK